MPPEYGLTVAPTLSYLAEQRCPHVPPCHTGMASPSPADDPQTEDTPAPGSFLFEDAPEPDHICLGAMHASLLHHATQRGLHPPWGVDAHGCDAAASTETAVWDWATTLPLPLGCGAIAEWRAGYRGDDGTALCPQIPALSDDPRAQAGLILHRRAASCAVRLFGLVESDLAAMTFEQMGESSFEQMEARAMYTWADPLLQIEGRTIADGEPIARALARWYHRKLLGKNLPGRPRGSLAFESRDDFLRKTALAFRSVQDSGETPTVERVAEAIRAKRLCGPVIMSPRTFRRCREGYGYVGFKELQADPRFRAMLAALP
ncbi:hypothetical protein HN371_07595 [Candidatus Poribacteria bacterium]|nr:hypothetical protein [Candidatus Poribacteria bacterium]MBT5533092.1 hypothetical protein [Candidatus Poribacteria bacterium]MBT5711721.1 hypothetical protein [Candidatus Poribacteria bacterium]MBT7099131.1 hypothetical protein [Candidatus Poribacteria bacterium]MBT7808184.1 hypothetical protein [Candidatus Poribacteria bacterium]